MANLKSPEVSAKAIIGHAVGPAVVRKTATINLASAPSLNDKLYMAVLGRCKIVGGELRGRELDTNGAATLRLDVGVLTGHRWENGMPVGGTLAQTKLHACTVAIAGEAVTDHIIGDGAKWFFHHLNKLADGDILLPDQENVLVVNVTAAAATFAAGPLTLAADYVEYPET
jgi:hypothetical protein